MLRLGADWQEKGFDLRWRTPADLPFLQVLYCSTRQEEMAAAGLPAALAAPFLSQQFLLQCRHYDQYYQDGGRRLIVSAQSVPIGRIELWDTDIPGQGPDLRLVDISLLPEWRNRGLGSALLRAVQTLAAAEDRSVSLQVITGSPAEALYRRHGFRPGPVIDIRTPMHWEPQSRSGHP